MNGEIQAGKEAASLLERMEKINLITDIINTGNQTRGAVLRSRAERQGKYIEDANANFEVMKEKFSTLQKIIRSEEDAKNLRNVEQAADGYKKAMNDFLALWQKNEEIAKKRTEVGNTVTAEAREVSVAGMEGGTKRTSRLRPACFTCVASAAAAMLRPGAGPFSVAAFVLRRFLAPRAAIQRRKSFTWIMPVTPSSVSR